MMIGTKNFQGYKGNSTAKWAKFPGEWLSHLSPVRDNCIDVVCNLYTSYECMKAYEHA